MRTAVLLAFALALTLFQANVHRVVGPTHLVGWTPNAVLPLVIFLGVHEQSMARGAILAFVIGHAQDLFASAPIGLFTFVYVALWWLARVAGVRFASQTVPTQMALAFGFSLVQSVMVLVLLVVFGSDPQRPVELAAIVFPNATATAILSPIVFRIAERLNQATLASQHGQEVA